MEMEERCAIMKVDGGDEGCYRCSNGEGETATHSRDVSGTSTEMKLATASLTIDDGR